MSDATVFFATNRKPDNPARPTAFTTDPITPTMPVYFGRGDFTAVNLTPESDSDTTSLSALGDQGEVIVARERLAPDTGNVASSSNGQSFSNILQGGNRGEANVLFYVHGYNFTFRQSLARAAQLQGWYAQGTKGMPLLIFLFDWASSGGRVSPGTYRDDRGRSKDSGQAMGRASRWAAESIGKLPNSPKIHVLAHSMGNWALRWAVQAQIVVPHGLPAFDQVILAAADEDDDTLTKQDKLKPILDASNRVSVYCNMYDLPLFSSDDIIGSGERLGQFGPADWQNLPQKVKTISVASVTDGRTDWEKHQYYRMNPFVRHDIQQVLQGIPDPTIDGRNHNLYHGQYVISGGVLVEV